MKSWSKIIVRKANIRSVLLLSQQLLLFILLTNFIKIRELSMQVPVQFDSTSGKRAYACSSSSIVLLPASVDSSSEFSHSWANNAQFRSEKRTSTSSCLQLPFTVFADVRLFMSKVLKELSNCMHIGLTFLLLWLLIITKKISAISWLTWPGGNLLNPSSFKVCHNRE